MFHQTSFLELLMRRWSRALARLPAALLPCALVIGFAVWLYWPVLHFNFLMDDSFDLVVARHARWSLLLLRPLYQSTYFRPFSFLTYKVVGWATGGLDPLPYHLLSLVLHLGSALLLLWLLQRLIGWWWATGPALLFLSFPFSYQAVFVISALPHLFVTTLGLGALVLWSPELGWIPRLRRLFALVLAALAPGFHETGVLVGFLLLGRIILQRSLWTKFHLLAGWLVAAFSSALLPLTYRLWVLQSYQKSTLSLVTWDDRGKNWLFWLQGVTYPVTRFLRVLLEPHWLTQQAASVVLVVSGVTLLLLFRFYAGARLWLLPLALVLLAILLFSPAAWFLPYGYLENGPRLLYPVAPVIATLWGLLPWAAQRWRRQPAVLSLLTSAVLAVTLMLSVRFVERRITMAHQASQLQEAVVQLARQQPGWPILVVNAPAWLAYDAYEFPLGHFGAPVQPDYHGYDALLEARLGWRQPIRSLAVAPPVYAGRYRFGPHGQAGTWAEVAAYQRSGWLVAAVGVDRQGYLTLQTLGRPLDPATASLLQRGIVPDSRMKMGPEY